MHATSTYYINYHRHHQILEIGQIHGNCIGHKTEHPSLIDEKAKIRLLSSTDVSEAISKLLKTQEVVRIVYTAFEIQHSDCSMNNLNPYFPPPDDSILDCLHYDFTGIMFNVHSNFGPQLPPEDMVPDDNNQLPLPYQKHRLGAFQGKVDRILLLKRTFFERLFEALTKDVEFLTTIT